ncbi:MAG TPA: hypothetical protein V6D29_23265 [Leptolyngbyaceae cyanobacterium]
MNVQPIDVLEPETREFYCQALGLLKQADVPFMIGGAYAFDRYTGIARHTKDLDLFARRSDVPTILDVFAQAGYETEVAVSHWLAKARNGENFVDIIFRSANGLLPVDDSWFEHAVEETVLDIPVLLCAPEEMIWSKGFVMSRDRYDGADVAHLILACGDQLDWERLLDHFTDHWRVLLSHLVLFGFIYPGKRSQIPSWVIQKLYQQLEQESNQPPAPTSLCQGTLLAPLQYKTDVEKWGYQDARLQPVGNLHQSDITEWVEHLKEETGNPC